jgi:membrane associated rhomboid family serine protease
MSTISFEVRPSTAYSALLSQLLITIHLVMKVALNLLFESPLVIFIAIPAPIDFFDWGGNIQNFLIFWLSLTSHFFGCDNRYVGPVDECLIFGLEFD